MMQQLTVWGPRRRATTTATTPVCCNFYFFLEIASFNDLSANPKGNATLNNLSLFCQGGVETEQILSGTRASIVYLSALVGRIIIVIVVVIVVVTVTTTTITSIIIITIITIVLILSTLGPLLVSSGGPLGALSCVFRAILGPS